MKRVVLLAVIAVALALACAGWKWSQPVQKEAGFTWDESTQLWVDDGATNITWDVAPPSDESLATPDGAWGSEPPPPGEPAP